MSGALLLDERMVSAQPSLVRAFGLTNAVVLQQIHWHHVYGDGTEHDGHAWFPITYAGLAGELGLSAEQVRRAVEYLEGEELLISCQPEGRASRRKWYRVNRAHPQIPEVANPPDRKRRTRQMGTGESAASSTSQPPEPEPPTDKPSKQRARFLEFDALVEAFGTPGTREEESFYAKTARSLKAQGKTPAEIVERGRIARQRHETCTVNVLLTRWSNFAPRPGRAAGSTWEDVAARDQERTNGQ